jgi:hypothetical protein
MKVYNLSCSHDHPFEGWFASEEDFIRQSDQQMIECPVCNDRSVRRLPSAPRLNLSGAPEPQGQPTASVPAKPGTSPQPGPQWLEIARAIVANTEDVGDNFAEEARRIHYKETPNRGIRGVASAAEREALSEEGIEVMQFPLPAALKQTLQ